MSIYDINSFSELVRGNSYVGRGIVTGMSADGKNAVSAYFIMGRSENSRNRVFRNEDGDIRIYPFDASKVSDPSLIIYYPVRKLGQQLIVTNGDQTDTLYDSLNAGKTFEEALSTRAFEPDAPNFTPRISALLTFDGGCFTYKQSILKSADEAGSTCNRYTFSYSPVAGLGHFIHTYNCDGTPIPTFTGEPERVKIPDGIDEFAEEIWNALDESNKIALYVRYDCLATGETASRLINRHHTKEFIG